MADQAVQSPVAQQPTPEQPVEHKTATPKRSPLLPAFIILITALVAVGAILIFFPKTQVPSKPTPTSQEELTLNKELEKGKVLLAKQIAQVGQEILYGKDLSYYFYQIDRPQFTNASEEQVKNTILSTLAEQSVVLQAAQKLNLIQLTKEVFNNLDKNQAKRIEVFNQAYAALQEQESKYTGEVVTIWYYNQKAPTLPVAQAQALAKQKLEAIRVQVAAGTLTMQQAAERVRADTSLSQLDANYHANAYYSFTDKPLPETSSIPSAQTVIAGLSVGALSPVVLIQDDASASSEVRQELYAIIKLTDKKEGKIEDFNEWLDNEKKQYPVKVF